MSESTSYPLIGEVISTHQEFLTFDNFPDISDSNEENLTVLMKGLYDGKSDQLLLTENDIKQIPRETLELLEKKGITVVKYDENHPYGTYGLEAAEWQLPLSADLLSDHSEGNTTEIETTQQGKEAVFALKNQFRNKIAVATYPEKILTKDKIEKAAFENIPTAAQVLAVCAKNNEGIWK